MTSTHVDERGCQYSFSLIPMSTDSFYVLKTSFQNPGYPKGLDLFLIPKKDALKFENPTILNDLYSIGQGGDLRTEFNYYEGELINLIMCFDPFREKPVLDNKLKQEFLEIIHKEKSSDS